MNRPPAAEIERVARKLWGEPNRALSSRYELRFGSNGSKSVDLRKRTWFDHEAGTGGGYRTMCELAGEPFVADGSDIVATYDYRDEAGKLLFQVVRKTGKRFAQRQPDPAARDGWRWALRGVRRAPYRLPELLAADPAQPVYVVEGEKDVDRLRELGLVATTNPGGAGKWRREYGEALRDRAIVILPDNDPPGRDHAEKVLRLLIGFARSACIVPLPHLVEKADVSDWLDAGGTVEALRSLVATAKPNGEAAAAAAIDEADVEPEIVRLARLPLVKYEHQRRAAAKLLNIRPHIVDLLVKHARGDGGETKGQGRPLDLPAPDPWPDSVDGDALLTALADYFARHAVLPEHADKALALWAVHCHCFTAFAITPRLHLKSAIKGSGKSTVFDLLKLVTPKTIEVETVTAAFLFRAIELVQPTVLLGEADRYLKAKDKEELVAAINAGAKQGGTAGRCVGEDQEPRMFSCHAPAALASIGNLPGTIEDRAIRITMQRRRRSDEMVPIDDAAKATAERLCRQAARWAIDHAAALRDARPDMGRLINRAADCWRPLYAIADLAGSESPNRARATQAALSPGDHDADSLGEQLLADIKPAFDDWTAEHAEDFKAGRITGHEITSAELVQRLTEMPGHPWAELGKAARPLTQNKLARLLRPFDVKPTQIGPEHDRQRGYTLLSFENAFAHVLGEG